MNTIAQAVWEKTKEILTGVGKEVGIEAFIETYHRMLVAFAREYLNVQGTDSEYLRTMKMRIMRMVRISVHVIDEIDAYIFKRHVDRWQEIKSTLEAAPKFEIEGKVTKKIAAKPAARKRK